jgi:hypothetical protein
MGSRIMDARCDSTVDRHHPRKSGWTGSRSRAMAAIYCANLVLKIDAAKNHAWRGAFKFRIDKLARRAFFDPIPQS